MYHKIINQKFLIIPLILLINIQTYLSSFITSGVNKFNDFIYLQRIKDFIKQNRSSTCSLSDGPNCLYTDNFYYNSKLFDKNNNNYSPDKEWYEFKNNSTTVNELYNNINSKILNYFSYHKISKDISYNEPVFDFETRLTFDAFDQFTKKNDIVLDSHIFTIFSDNGIRIYLEGKLKLRHDNQKLIVKGNMDYPTNTYLIIESHSLKISMDKKYFRCKSFFVRPYNKDNVKIQIIGQIRQHINIEGYDENRLVFTTSLDFSYSDEKYWHKINLSSNTFITKLVIPGNFEVDNFTFYIKGNYLYDIESQFYNHPTQKSVTLINDDEI